MIIKIETDMERHEIEGTIDTDSFMEETLDLDEELTAHFHKWVKDNEDEDDNSCSFIDWAKEHSGEWLGFEVSVDHGDNTYNSPHDLSAELNYAIVSEADDWFYSDDTLIYVERHHGGDVRGNYGTGRIFKMSGHRDAAFLDREISWHAVEINGMDRREYMAKVKAETGAKYCQEPYEEFERYYQSECTYHLNEAIEKILKHDKDNGITVLLKDGNTVKFYGSAY